MEAHGRDPTHLEFFKETHSKEGGGFVANTAKGFLVYVLILLLVLSFLFLWTNYDTNSISS